MRSVEYRVLPVKRNVCFQKDDVHQLHSGGCGSSYGARERKRIESG